MRVSRIKPPDVITRKHCKGILAAFLKGKQNANWVVGCLKNTPLYIFDECANELRYYTNYPRFVELAQIRKRLFG